MPQQHTPESFTRNVVRREAGLRGVTIDWDAPLPPDVPEELRHAVFKVADRGWCVWASKEPGTGLMPADRDFHPLERVLPDRWALVGWNGVHVC